MEDADGDDGDALLLGEHGHGDHEADQHHAPPPQPARLTTHLPVLEEHQEEEDGGEELGPAHHPCHGLCVDGVDGEEEGGHGGRDVGEEARGEGVVEEGDRGVEDDIDQVVAQGLELVQEIVEAEGEDSERSAGRSLPIYWYLRSLLPVGLVTLLLLHRRAPEVIVKEVG